MPNLAQTTFQTSAQDDLATVDAYTQSSAADPIDVAAPASGDPNGVAGFLGLGSLTVPSISSLTSDAASLVNSRDATAGLMDALPDLQSPFSNLDTSLQNQLTAVVPNTPSLTSVVDTTLPSFPSVSASLSAKNVGALSGMLDVVGKQTAGSLAVTPTSVNASFMSNLLKMSVSAGIPNAYARIDAGNLGPTVMAAVTKTGLSTAVSTSNLNLLANLSNGSMATSIKGMAPGFTAAFAANFKLPAGTTPSSHAQISADISSAFGKIDARWASKTNVAGNTVANANLFVNGSPDFRTVMKAAVTLSRNPLATTTSVVASVSATTLPSILNLPPGTTFRSTVSPHGMTASFAYRSGETHTYVPNLDGTYDQTIVAPADPTTGQLGALDNSAITDPMALSGLYGQCLTDGSSSSNVSGLPDPTLNAAASLAQTFPLAYTGDLMNLG